MFLYFSNWTNNSRLENLMAKGAPAISRLIKVYASPVDPREMTGRNIFVVESPHEPFAKEERYNYALRGTYQGPEIETMLGQMQISPTAAEASRALFRFGNGEIGCIALGMQVEVNGQWFLDHPLFALHGLAEAQKRPIQRDLGIHLDLFANITLARLEKMFDLNNPNLVFSEREAAQFIQALKGEKAFKTKEG